MKNVAIETCDSYRAEAVNAALDRLFADLGMDPKNPFGGGAS